MGKGGGCIYWEGQAGKKWAYMEDEGTAGFIPEF